MARQDHRAAAAPHSTGRMSALGPTAVKIRHAVLSCLFRPIAPRYDA